MTIHPAIGIDYKVLNADHCHRSPMLKHLAISHFAIVEHLELDCLPGMTVISGETGAGKSIMLDALGLCLGDRADPKAVQPGASRAEICADFDITHLPAVAEWLNARDLDRDGACLLRRTVNADGRSRAFINGTPSTLADCAALGELLIDIHSQHAHQSLLRRPVQQQLLDAYSGCTDLSATAQEVALEWRTLQARLEQLSQQNDNELARRDLLRYQIEELDMLALDEGEVESLERHQKTLSNANFIIESALRAGEVCEQQTAQLHTLMGDITDSRHAQDVMANAVELINGAKIQLEEARHDLLHYADNVETNPERLDEITHRLTLIYDLARKHRVLPEQLSRHHQDLIKELAALDGGDQHIEALRMSCEAAHQRWQTVAAKLSRARQKGAKALTKRTLSTLATLAMERCQLTISLTPREESTPHPQGAETVDFLIATNPGVPPGPLSKVASGGELSRISLALQVAAAEVATSPTMIFDEVDVGIGGSTAEIVGELLQSLAERVQVICVTHLPQVAAKGHHHLQVHKSGNEQQVTATMTRLEPEARVEEIARMLGGRKITATTRSSAREMLAGS